MATKLWGNGRWQVVVPERRLTAGQLGVIVDQQRPTSWDHARAASLIEAYRRTRSALWQVEQSRGFAVSFAMDWSPDEHGVGQPDAVETVGCAVHVFGRRPDEPLSPVRAMGLPRSRRRYVPVDQDQLRRIAAALAKPAMIAVPAPPETDCDGCHHDVSLHQERWRADGVRVIRPRRPVIESQVMVLPLRHVVSLGDLEAEELVSLVTRLWEVLDHFRSAGVTGLSCFANDGTAARQETPHVHLHVLGRSRSEPVNPFQLLAAGTAASPPNKSVAPDSD